MENNRILSNILDWFSHPLYSDESVVFWLAALVGLLAVSFLWSTVVRSLEV